MSDYESTTITFNSGDYLYVEGDESERIFRLRDGAIEVTRDNEVITRYEERGHPVGIADTALQISRQTTAKVTEESSLKSYGIRSERVFDWIEDHPVTGLKVIENNAEMLDHFNKENKDKFDDFRDVRSIFDPLLKPLSMILTELHHDDSSLPQNVRQKLNSLLEKSLLKSLVSNYRTIVNSIGRSVKKAPSDLDVPEDVQESYDSDEKICEEGGEDETFYVLLSGTLSVHKKHQRVATIDEPGSIFGEMSALLHGKRTATIIADTDVKVAAFPYEKLRKIFEESPELGKTILRTFLKRLQRAVTLNNNLENILNQFRKIEQKARIPKETKKRLKTLIKVSNQLPNTDDNIEYAVGKLQEFLDTYSEKLKSRNFS